MSPRDRIYLQILEFGLISLRNASYRGDVDYWKIESDHLHNIPSLIGETQESRHYYYFCKERPLYLSRVPKDDPDGSFAMRRYEELWPELEALNRAHEPRETDPGDR